MHDLASEMGEQLEAIASSLAYFTEVGVPTIRLNQKHGAANLQNLSTVATFFSAGSWRRARGWRGETLTSAQSPRRRCSSHST
jgi:hypothetical protein